MIETMFIDLPQFNVYHNSVSPIVRYYREHINSFPSESEIDKLLPYAKQTDFILTTFHEIVDDLNYDKEKFENIIYTFDDDYDMLKDFISKLNPRIKSHYELLEISDKILTNLIKAQNELGIIISQHEHRKI
jgi:histidinol phosphatase-like PHP family hydrolase